MKLIDISTPKHPNTFTMIDDEDFEFLNKFKWSCTAGGYAARRGEKNGKIWLHRLLLNVPKGVEVDHINGDKLDNRTENLRICTHAENTRNRFKMKSKATSRYKGVNLHPEGKYIARISVNNSSVYLGLFKDEISAASAYNSAAIRYYGEYAKINEVQS